LINDVKDPPASPPTGVANAAEMTIVNSAIALCFGWRRESPVGVVASAYCPIP